MKRIESLARKIIRAPESYLALGLVLVLCVLHFGSTRMDQVRLFRDGVPQGTNFPIAANMRDGEPFAVEMTLHPGFFGRTQLNIHPDDCADSIVVNGTPLDVNAYPGHCDWTNGFVIPPEVIESAGATANFRFVMHNNGGLGGMLLSPENQSFWPRALEAVALLLAGLILLLTLRRFRVNTAFAAILVAGILMRFVYVQDTTYDKRGHDISGHIDYVRIIAEEHRIPGAHDCWTCYHPPVYYAVSALPWNAANAMKTSPQGALQWESFAFSVAVLVFGLLALRTFVSGGAFAVAGVLFALWPSLILTSARIGNDQLFYLLHIVCFWACAVFLSSRKLRYLSIAAIAAGLAFATKSTGAVSLAVWSVTAILGYLPFHKPSRREIAAWSVGLIICAVCAAYLLGHDISGNTGGLKWVDVGNKPGNYLFFDVRNFLTQPYTDPFNDEMGRQYFWNYLAKTSLFGEFSLLTTALGEWLASIISVVFLILCGFSVRGLFKAQWTKTGILFAVQGVLFTLAALAFRIKYPFSCSNDFRYIMPVLLSFTPFIAIGIFGGKARARVRIPGMIISGIFAAAAVLLLILLP